MAIPVMISLSMAWQCSNCGIVGNDYLADVPFGADVIVATHTCGNSASVATMQQAAAATQTTAIQDYIAQNNITLVPDPAPEDDAS